MFRCLDALEAGDLGSAGQEVLVAKAVAVGPTGKTEDPGLEPWRLETWDLLARELAGLLL